MKYKVFTEVPESEEKFCPLNKMRPDGHLVVRKKQKLLEMRLHIQMAPTFKDVSSFWWKWEALGQPKY